MATSFSTNEANWQGVDDEPIAGSENMIKSGGLSQLGLTQGKYKHRFYIKSISSVTFSFDYKIGSFPESIKLYIEYGDVLTTDNQSKISLYKNNTTTLLDKIQVNGNLTTIQSNLEKIIFFIPSSAIVKTGYIDFVVESESYIDRINENKIKIEEIKNNNNSSLLIEIGGLNGQTGEKTKNTDRIRTSMFLVAPFMISVNNNYKVRFVARYNKDEVFVDYYNVDSYGCAETNKNYIYKVVFNKSDESDVTYTDLQSVIYKYSRKDEIELDNVENKLNNIASVVTKEKYVDLTGDNKLTIKVGSAINYKTGEIVPNDSVTSYIFDLSDKKYTKFKVKSNSFSSNYGYGFFSGNIWYNNVCTNYIGEVEIDIPYGATEFRFCYNKTMYDNNPLYGYCYESIISENLKVAYKYPADIKIGAVSSTDGSVNTSLTNCGYIEIDVSDASYVKISGFKSTTFSSLYGYGFVLSDNSWVGYHMNQEIGTVLSVDVPKNAVLFKGCWNRNTIHDNYFTVTRNLSLQEYTNIIPLIKASENLNLMPFENIVVPDCNSDESEINLNTATVSDIYSLWDSLVQQNPTFLKSTTLGNDQSGEYTLRQIVYEHSTSYNYPSEDVNVGAKRKVIILSNVHGPGTAGDSRLQSYVIYWFIKWIIENRHTNTLAMWFALNYKFVIMPIGNPWGFDNNSRGNVRNVDINRNFDVAWVRDTSYETYTTGDSAASEVETQIIQTFINNNKQDVYCYIDFHSHLDNSSREILALTDDKMNRMGTYVKRYCEIVDTRYIQCYPFFAQATSLRYAIDICGLNGITLEGTPRAYPGDQKYSSTAMTNSLRMLIAMLRFSD